MILFRPGDGVASADVDARLFREAIAAVVAIRPESALQLSFRRSWAGNGYTVLLRAVSPKGETLTEFMLWRFSAMSHGILKDAFDQWHETEAGVADELLGYLMAHKAAEHLRIRVIPKGENTSALLSVSPAPENLSGRLFNDRVWATERVVARQEDSRDVLPDWSLAGDGIALLDGMAMLAEMRRIRGPGRAARVPHLARMQAMPAVTFDMFDPRIEHAQRILHVERVQGGITPEEETEDKVDVYLPAMCSRRVPGSITWFSNYDDTVRALAACQHIMGDKPFRARMCFDDGSGWLWFAPEGVKDALSLDDDVRRDMPFFVAVAQRRPALSEQLMKLIAEVDPSALTLEDLFVQQERESHPDAAI
jgi:hypothetical protein